MKSNKPPPPPKLTKAKLQGRAYLQSFGELTQFLTVAKPDEPQPATTTPTPEAPPEVEPPQAVASPPPSVAESPAVEPPPADESSPS